MLLSTCSFCYSPIPPAAQKYCGKCKRGVYCSKDCQVSDWAPCHKKWCGVPYGIRNRDWEIRFISETKGHGVVALRRFELDDRIMVERMLQSEEIVADERLKAAVMQLVPMDSERYQMNATDECLAGFGDDNALKVKYMLNSLGSRDDRGDFGGICVEMAKINHACEPNATTYLDLETMRMVLHASRAIEPGEEITISYTDGLDPTTNGGIEYPGDLDPVSNGSLDKHRLRLVDQYGIVCPEDCECFGPLTKLRASKALETEMFRLVVAGDVNAALEKGTERIRLHATDALRVRFRLRLQLVEQFAQMGLTIEGLALFEIAKALTRPGSEEALSFQKK